jgi:cell wall-associated NlpC family hydrolase
LLKTKKKTIKVYEIKSRYFFMKIRILLFVLALFFLLAGCLKQADTIKDVSELRQSHAFYLTETIKEKEPLSAQAQSQMDEDYNIIYFSVWHQRQPFHALPERVSLDFTKFSKNLGYGENKKKHSQAWIKKLRQNAALKNYPNALYAAITTRNTNLRVLPTQGPQFSSPDGDSSGWPFDNLQRSSVAANTPIFICHISADKSWALVETSYAFGWMPAEDFARVDAAFIETWECGRYAVITGNQTSILDKENNFILRASLGHIFPLVNEMPDKLGIIVAATDESNKAVIKTGFVSREQSAVKPLRFNYPNAARIADELIGEVYGWGGLYGNRDCSAMTRDFFAPFGIWLPRNSEDQVKEVGTYMHLQGLTPEEKEKVILDRGIPYLSLLWLKGHVMLYIGRQNGRALIFHNIWGIRTKDETGKEGRYIIGQAVITTLRLDYELNGIDQQYDYLLNRISAMNILVPQQQSQQTQQNSFNYPSRN